MDYLTSGFIDVRLTDYKLNGNSYISFEYLGESNCAQTQVSVVDEMEPSSNNEEQLSLLLNPNPIVPMDAPFMIEDLGLMHRHTYDHPWAMSMNQFNHSLVSEVK